MTVVAKSSSPGPFLPVNASTGGPQTFSETVIGSVTASDSVTYGTTSPWSPTSGTTVTPTGERTFDSYSSSTEFLAATSDWRNGADDLNASTNNMQIVTRAWSTGGLTNALQYTWTDQGTNSLAIGRGVNPGANVTEVWMEVILAYSTNYAVCNPSSNPCAHKWIFWPVRDGGDFQGRVELHNGGGGQGTTGPFQPSSLRKRVGTSSHPSSDIKEIAGSPTPFVHDLTDGDWHSFKSHVRIERGTTFGIQEIAYDNDGDSLDWDVDVNAYPSTGASRIYALQFGRNKDKGQDSGTENIWISRIRWWSGSTNDPGWSGLQG